MVAWQDIPWKKVQRHVFRLQKGMYRATQRGDVRTAHKLQKLLVKSWYARLLAVRRISQDNRGHDVYTMTAVICRAGSCGIKATDLSSTMVSSRAMPDDPCQVRMVGRAVSALERGI